MASEQWVHTDVSDVCCMLMSVTVSYTVSYTVCDDYMSTCPSICVRKLMALGLDDAESRGRWVSTTLDLEIRWHIS